LLDEQNKLVVPLDTILVEEQGHLPILRNLTNTTLRKIEWGRIKKERGTRHRHETIELLKRRLKTRLT